MTPIKYDKRLWLTAGVIAAVLGLVAAGRAPNAEVLAFLGTATAFFCGQSQWGQTTRAKAEKADAQ